MRIWFEPGGMATVKRVRKVTEMDSQKRLRLLKDEISEAFKDVPYPGDDNIATTKRDEQLEHLAEFKGKHWKELTFEFLVPRHWSSMHFMTLEAYRFYLPAFLMISAEFYYESDVLVEYTLRDLVLPLEKESESSLRREFVERFGSMTAQQKRAIRLFLEFIRDAYPHDPIYNDHNIALERYWGDK